MKSTHYRACHLCEAICGLEIMTEDERIVSIKGDHKDYFSRGHICAKGVALQDIHNDPDRLKTPRKRLGSKWISVSWEDALEEVADQLCNIQSKYGNDAVGVYAGNPNVHNYGNLTHGILLRKALQTTNNFSATSLDQLPHQFVALKMYGHQFLLPIPDIDHLDLFIIIGGNPLASNGSMMTVPDVRKRLKNIQQRGGQIITIDPRCTETAKVSDQYLSIVPGTDAFLLLAMLNYLFEQQLVVASHLQHLFTDMDKVIEAVKPFTLELAYQQTGIEVQQIIQLVQQLVNTPKASVYGRMGVSTQQFGTICQWAIQLLNLFTNHVDVKGSTLLNSPVFGYIDPQHSQAQGSFARRYSRVSKQPEFSGEYPSCVLSEEILTPGDGQIKGMVTIAGNPVLSAPNGRLLDKAFAELDYMVAIDFYVNETTKYADIILPPTSPLEHDHYDLAFNRLAVRNVTRFNQPIFKPTENCRHDWQIYNELSMLIANKKELPISPYPPPEVMIDKGIKANPHYSLDIEQIKKYPHGLDLGELTPSMKQRICTQDGFIHLAPQLLIDDCQRLQKHSKIKHRNQNQFYLIGRRDQRSNNSWMHNYTRLVKGEPRWQLWMHPSDMENINVNDNAEVQICSRVGHITTLVKSSADLKQGVVCLPHGWGHQRQGVHMKVASTQEGVSMNDITDEQFIDSLTGNAALNGLLVEVTPV